MEVLLNGVYGCSVIGTVINLKWESVFSEFFPVNNGVRQGGIMSPLLFNLYINDLSLRVRSLPVGCYCGDMVVNHLRYVGALWQGNAKYY